MVAREVVADDRGHGLILLWAGVGSAAALNAFGYNPFVAQGTSLVFFSAWALQTLSVRQIVVGFLSTCMEVFFSEVTVRGVHKLEQDPSPMIFVCAPHCNQFLDPILVMKTTKREVSFLTAKSSMSRAVIGPLCHAVKVVPVERPQDLAKLVKGVVTLKAGSTTLHGKGTTFTTDFDVGMLVMTSNKHLGKAQARVKEVCSDTQLKLDTPMRDKDGNEVLTTDEKIKAAPKLDQSTMFEDVFQRLAEGGTVGIFPEGGSHDRAQLLPLKAGVSIMALGAMSAFPGLKVKIVPVGLNYFSGHRFRSRVYLDYGDPMEVPLAMVERYNEGGAEKKKVCAEFMDKVLGALRTVTVEAEDRETLELFWMLRRLYMPDLVNRTLSIESKIALTRGFAQGYEKVKEEREVKDLMFKISEYNNALQAYQINDHKVVSMGLLRNQELSKAYVMLLLMQRLGLILFYLLAAAPGLVLASPMACLAKIVSQQQAKKAVKNSSVKIKGNDVLGTWKVLLGMVFIPVLHLSYTFIAHSLWGDAIAITYFFFMPFLSGSSILATEQCFFLAKSTRTLFTYLLGKRTGQELWETRQELQAEVQKLVNELGWTNALTSSSSSLNLFSAALSEEDKWANWDDTRVIHSVEGDSINNMIRVASKHEAIDRYSMRYMEATDTPHSRTHPGRTSPRQANRNTYNEGASTRGVDRGGHGSYNTASNRPMDRGGHSPTQYRGGVMSTDGASDTIVHDSAYPNREPAYSNSSCHTDEEELDCDEAEGERADRDAALSF
jgi:glycerol-3-phosphate O-acyltransferase/dihydroxyacetone phosphate acyltransferase